MDEKIRKVLDRHAKLKVDAFTLDADDDLYGLGLTSHGTVNVMLGLEDDCGVEFPIRLMMKSTFQSIHSIRDALIDLGVPTEA